MSGAFAGQRALVVGFGISGSAAAHALAEEGAEVRVSEARSTEELDGVEVPAGVELRAGGHRPEDLDGMTLVVVSPGIPQDAPILGWAVHRGLEVWSELELGARLCRVPVVAVTGTNGKTTTVEMLAAAMRAAGLSAVACGNVGHPFSLAAREGHQALAVEASSFQLRFHRSFHPTVSVLLNLAPDHLDWHGSLDSYAEAKARIFALQKGDDSHIGNRQDRAAAEISRRARCRLRWFGGKPRGPGDTGIRDGTIILATEGTPPVEVARYRGGHTVGMDMAATCAAAFAFGLPLEAIGEALEAFRPLPHRGSVVAEVDGIRFVDDSKATNPHAALAALQGLSDAVLIAGGLAKGVDLSPLAAAAGNLAAVVAIGEAAPEIAAVLGGLVPVTLADSMAEAVGIARAEARPGSIVLLAPACASQDMFRDYRQRGDSFAAAARALAPKRSGAVPRSIGG
jgi:UDP-N-acetylmuramoylalanine--D-glutamate ligase